MASAFRGSVLKCIKSSLQNATPASGNVCGKWTVPLQIASRGLTLNRCLSSIARTRHSLRSLNRLSNQLSVCQRCQFHTEGDQKLAEFLDDEIKGEKGNSPSSVSKVEGWDVQTDGTGVILTKSFKDEKIKIEFDVNDSVNEEAGDAEENADPSKSNMVSRPPFEVEITKKSGRKLTFTCEFNIPEPSFGEQVEEDVEDQFSIIEVRIDEKTSTSGMDNFYSHSSGVMDGTLYDMLMDMLDERGVDDTFVNNMVDFATSYEHKQYVEFLEKLKSVIKE